MPGSRAGTWEVPAPIHFAELSIAENGLLTAGPAATLATADIPGRRDPRHHATTVHDPNQTRTNLGKHRQGNHWRPPDLTHHRAVLADLLPPGSQLPPATCDWTILNRLPPPYRRSL